MARTSDNPRVNNRTVRLKLTPRTDPYWHLIAEGQHVGYRRMKQGTGTWIARVYSRDSGRRFKALGAADDVATANGSSVLSFAQAIEQAQRWFKGNHAEAHSGPYTVAQAMTDYLADREQVKRRKLPHIAHQIAAHIVPALGSLDLAKLTPAKVKAWRDALEKAAPRVRTKAGEAQKFRDYDPNDADALRARQASVNRILTTFKAAMNLAHEQHGVGNRDAWERVKKFQQVDQAKVRFLTTDEVQKLTASCSDSFGDLVRGALLTGARYGELTALTVADFDANQGTIFIRQSKNGKARHVHLNQQGIILFAKLAAGKDATDPLFVKDNGIPWAKSEQKRPIDVASQKAELEQVTFHILRHTYASQLAMAGTSMNVIAEQLGHTSTRITEKHYAHLSKAYVRETIQANLPTFSF